MKSNIQDRFSKEEKAYLKKLDPDVWKMLAAAPWQDPDNFSTISTTITEVPDYFPMTGDDVSKPQDINWRGLQKLCWRFYKTFGALNASVNSKADDVAQAGFSVYSDDYVIDLFLQDLFYSYRNKLYEKVPSWVIRMQGEGELFILLAFDEEGTCTVRNLEPERIGEGESDMGLIVDPDDVTQTLFYQYTNTTSKEFIPDARWILEPEYMKERMKALKSFDASKISQLTKGKGKFSKIGGYRRFVLHWKNLTGIHEYKRDTSSLSTVLEWINLYVKAVKWGLDHKRALSAYAWGIEFEDSPTGKVAWHVWNKMTQAEKDATNLTKPMSPGTRVFLMPGLKLAVYNPQIPSLSGSNQDLLNLSGAGARTPMDLWQGQTAGSTYASIKETRPPLVAEIEHMQSKFENFLRFAFLRLCFTAKLAMGGTVLDAALKKQKLPEVYKTQWVTAFKNGKPSFKNINVELCLAAKFTWPVIQMDSKPDSLANAHLGSKHTGIRGLKVSDERIARAFGIDDLSRQRRVQAVEEDQYGAVETGSEAEKGTEEEFKKTGAESGDTNKNKEEKK